MVDKTNFIRMALDAMRGGVSGNFSAADTSESIRQALIEANGGSEKLNLKTFHRGNPCFDLIEELIPHIVEEGLRGDEFFFNMVDYRNLAEGDAPEFWTEDKSEFIVADVANGTQGIRRQRLNAGENTTIKTTPRAIKVYEELRRLMAGRVDFNTFVDKVGKAITREMRSDIYTAFNGITAATAGLNDTYVKSGTFSEEKLLELIGHVEAKTGKAAKIIGTKTALRKITTAVVADEAKSDMYNLGFYGRFNGTDMVAMRQVHKNGTDTFLLDDNKIYVIASEEKPVKFVNEGEALIVQTDPTQNADLTQEYLCIQQWGVGVMFDSVIGIYTITG